MIEYTSLSFSMMSCCALICLRSSSNSCFILLSSIAVRRRNVRPKIDSACSNVKPYFFEMSKSFASAESLEFFTRLITSSIRCKAFSMPSTTCSLFVNLVSWNKVRRRIVSNLNLIKIVRISLSNTRFGCVPLSTRANMFPEKLVWSEVFLNKLFCTTAGMASRFNSTTTRIPSLSLSSLKSAMPSSFLSFTKSATFSSSMALLVIYGSSVIIMALRVRVLVLELLLVITSV
mmetsp:Transcript_8314/g.12401  ORF Transcript_8314/g.12401 Transcript_8314/m.12401 type:complete len:232 (+) Transcript_8314:1520-2215(+)